MKSYLPSATYEILNFVLFCKLTILTFKNMLLFVYLFIFICKNNLIGGEFPVVFSLHFFSWQPRDPDAKHWKIFLPIAASGVLADSVSNFVLRS